MKDNEKYSFKNTEKSKIITFEKGCMVDAEVLFNEIFGSTFLQSKFVDLDHGKPTDFQKKTTIKISKRIIVEIKAVANNKKL